MSQNSFFPPLFFLLIHRWILWKFVSEVGRKWKRIEKGEAESYGNHLKKLLFLIMKEYAWKA